MPDAREIVIILATLASVAQYFGVTAPAIDQGAKNQDGITFWHDQLTACDIERVEWKDRYLAGH